MNKTKVNILQRVQKQLDVAMKPLDVVMKLQRQVEKYFARFSVMPSGNPDEKQTHTPFDPIQSDFEFRNRIEAKLDRIIELLEDANRQAKT